MLIPGILKVLNENSAMNENYVTKHTASKKDRLDRKKDRLNLVWIQTPSLQNGMLKLD
jgi:hypothetical protein